MTGLNGNIGGSGNEGQGEWGTTLAQADAAALDALIESNWNLAQVGVLHRERAAQILAVLGSLDAPGVSVDAALEDMTMLRVTGVVGAFGHGGSTDAPELSRSDAKALDALVHTGYVPGPGGSERASRYASLLALLDTPMTMPSASVGMGDLVTRTLGRVQSHVEKQADRFSIASEAERSSRRGFRMADLLSVAAMLAFGTIAIWPMLTAAKERSRRMACENTMATAGIAFGTYSGDNRDSMPLASSCEAGSQWWNVGQSPEQSNSANLFTLIRTGHAKVEDLACNGNPSACRCITNATGFDWKKLSDVSYSYQNMYTPAARRPRWSDDNRSVAMIDRSPVILKAIRRELINPMDNSPNHGGLGQNALLTDGSTNWMRNPVLENGDNVWLPRQLEQVLNRIRSKPTAQPLRGTEAPDLGDAFLVP
ncbi:MAG: hypothetical protein H7Y88_05015 [Phycisphaerales bacterium]|nr:hypothetical protein [Phycisphaerales bacterium]